MGFLYQLANQWDKFLATVFLGDEICYLSSKLLVFELFCLQRLLKFVNLVSNCNSFFIFPRMPHVLQLVANVPFKSEQFSFDTFANEEKNLALFDNSPPIIATIFMSLGTSPDLKVTLRPSISKTFPSRLVIS